jgi:hypothetical protein
MTDQALPGDSAPGPKEAADINLPSSSAPDPSNLDDQGKLKYNKKMLETEIFEDRQTIKSLQADIQKLDRMKASLSVKFTRRSCAAYMIMGIIMICVGLWLLNYDFPENVICMFNIVGPTLLFIIGAFFIVVFGIVLLKLDTINEADQKKLDRAEEVREAKLAEIARLEEQVRGKEGRLAEMEEGAG